MVFCGVRYGLIIKFMVPLTSSLGVGRDFWSPVLQEPDHDGSGSQVPLPPPVSCVAGAEAVQWGNLDRLVWQQVLYS